MKEDREYEKERERERCNLTLQGRTSLGLQRRRLIEALTGTAIRRKMKKKKIRRHSSRNSRKQGTLLLPFQPSDQFAHHQRFRLILMLFLHFFLLYFFFLSVIHSLSFFLSFFLLFFVVVSGETGVTH